MWLHSLHHSALGEMGACDSLPRLVNLSSVARDAVAQAESAGAICVFHQAIAIDGDFL